MGEEAAEDFKSPLAHSRSRLQFARLLWQKHFLLLLI